MWDAADRFTCSAHSSGAFVIPVNSGSCSFSSKSSRTSETIGPDHTVIFSDRCGSNFGSHFYFIVNKHDDRSSYRPRVDVEDERLSRRLCSRLPKTTRASITEGWAAGVRADGVAHEYFDKLPLENKHRDNRFLDRRTRHRGIS